MSRTHTEATRAKIRQKARERYEWDDAKVERIKALVLSGASSREIARQERVYRGTLAKFCDEHGLARKERRGFNEAGNAVLREGYETDPDLAGLLARYQQARGYPASYEAMRQNASRLNLHRPRTFPNAPKTNSRAHLVAEYAEARAAVAPALQEWLNTGIGLANAAKRMGISAKRAYRMWRDGLVTRPPLPTRQPRPAKVTKEKKPKVAAPPKPKKLPASWVRTPAPPPPPKPTYQTVEAFLAAGGRITHCPPLPCTPPPRRLVRAAT